jgi:hypothetical protein
MLCCGEKKTPKRQMFRSACKQPRRGIIGYVVSHDIASRFVNTTPGHVSLHGKFQLAVETEQKTRAR